MDIKSLAPTLPNITLGLDTPKIKDAKSASKVEQKKPIASDSAEELAMAVAAKMGDNKKNIRKDLSKTLLKRVDNIKKVQELTKQLDSRDKVDNISKKITDILQKTNSKKDSEIESYMHKLIEKGEDPAVILLSLKSLSINQSLNEENTDRVSILSEELLSEDKYSNQILASFNVGGLVSKNIDDPNVASNLRLLIAKGNTEKLSANSILITLLNQGGEGDYDKTLKVYYKALMNEYDNRFEQQPSARIPYLIDKNSKLNAISDATSLIDVGKTLSLKVKEKTGENINPINIVSLMLEYLEDSTQDKIDEITSSLVKIGKEKKLYAANIIQKAVKDLPLAHWDTDSERNQSIEELLLYSSRNSGVINSSSAPINKAFL